MAATDYFTRKTSTGRIRPAATAQAAPSDSPTTPQTPILSRSYSSALNSPSASFRASDDEPLLVEIGSRHLRAGLAGERAPRCILNFGPEEQRRAGDYRRWRSDTRHSGAAQLPREHWGEDHELWQMDLSKVDLGLVEDKLERVVRKASTTYLMDTAQKPRRIFLALPPTLPHALLTASLTTLFTKTHAPTITLLPTPVLSAVAAGLRSALVVDVGWSETIVTAVYEYREVQQRRSDRAAKALCQEFGSLLQSEASHGVSDHAADAITFEQAEEVMTRLGWCRSGRGGQDDDAGHDLQPSSATDQTLHIPLQPGNTTQKPLTIPFSRLAEPVEVAWFARDAARQDLDDNEQPLHELAFNTLLALPVDIRGICMSRVLVTGGGAQLPGIKRRLLGELNSLLRARGWDPVRDYGSTTTTTTTTNPPRNGSEHAARASWRSQTTPSAAREYDIGAPSGPSQLSSSDPPNEAASTAANQTNQEHDPIADKLARERWKAIKPSLRGVVRGVETAGAFAGLSILAITAFRVKGVVEIDKDTFLMHGGLASASRGRDVVVSSSQSAQRQSLGPGVASGTRSNWTLAGWG
jgi:hypothetical protein